MNSKYIYFIIIIGLCLISCSTQPVQKAPISEQQPPPQEPKPEIETAKQESEDSQTYDVKLNNDEKADLYYSILLASIADARQAYGVARDNYLKAAQITGHPAYSRSAVLASERIKDFETSLMAAELWSVQNPQDLQASEITTIGYLRKSEPSQALPHFIKLIDQLPNDNNEQAYRALLRLVRTVRTEATLELLQLAIKEKPNAAYLWLLSSQVATFLKDKGIANDAANRALEIAPNFITAVKQKAHLLFIDRHIEAAETLLLKQLATKPNNRELLIGLSRLLYDLKEYDKTLVHLNKIIINNPNDIEARYLSAISHHALKQWSQAIQQFQFLIQLNYQRDLAYFYSADAYEQLGQLQRALQSYEAIKMGSYYTRAGIRRAAIIAKLKTPESGLMLLQNMLSLSAEPESIHLAKTELINEHFGLNEAAITIDQLIKENPDNLNFRFKRIWLYLQHKKVDTAQAVAEQDYEHFKTIQLQKNYLLTASVYFRQADYINESLALLSKGLVETPDDIDLLYSRALFSEAVGDYQQLESDLRKILALDQDSADAMNALGYTLADLNKNLDEAETLIYKAYQMMPTNAAVIDSMGWLHFRKRDYTKAIKFLRRAARLDKSGEIVAHLAEALWYSGQQEEAVNTLKQFIKHHPDDKKTNTLLEKLESKK